jgi:diguanylate cyclase (GGDEF)-like protein/PAS domain S-box-containing protein
MTDKQEVFPAAHSHDTRQKILLVDDHVENLVALEAILDDGEVALLRATSGEEALQMLLDNDVAMVLLDIAMPGMDGYEVAALMRSSRRTRNIPIIFLTAFMRDEDAAIRGYKSGAIDYLLKPVNATILRCKVAIFLELDRRQRQLVHASRRLDDQRVFFQSILNAAGEGVIGLDVLGKVSFANPAAMKMLNFTPETFIGEAFSCFYLVPGSSTWETSPFHRALSSGQELRVDEAVFKRSAGDTFPVSYCCSPLAGRAAGVVLVFQDITRRKSLEEQLRLQAQTDHLTGLYNRNGFKQALQASLTRNTRHHKHLALLFIDLDHFKQINDTLGHDAGDVLLQGVAQVLKDSVRANDIVGRLGGDEFTVVLEELDNPEDSAVIACKILAALRQPFPLNHHGMEILVSASIGIATYPGCGNDPGSLMQAADVAMYRAKSEGRNLYQFFTPEMNAKAKARLMLEQSLRRALDQQELSLHYQPQVEIHSGRIVGIEALMRWQHPNAGMVSPATFVPLLEETGLIVQVGAWTIETACRQRAEWHRAGLLDADCTLAVNISPRQFASHSLLDCLQQSLSLNQLQPQMLEVELTEGSLMHDTDATRRMLNDMRQLGVRLSVDDFGTGYSSLAYLKLFDIDTLKIDKSFVDKITHDKKDEAISASIVNLAHNLEMTVVAEGVETLPQLLLLRQIGCDVVQGYYYAKPMPAAELEAFVRNWPQGTLD